VEFQQERAQRAATYDRLRRVAAARMPTRWGMFRAIGFERAAWEATLPLESGLALVMGDLTQGAPLLRIHSQCFTGEGLGSLRCDCGEQLSLSMQAIADEGCGIVIYEYQEGRGIGLMAKLRAYELQDGGLDTVEANHVLGFPADCRDFSLSVAILGALRINRVRLLTNNPRKSRALSQAGIEVTARIPCEVTPTPYSVAYLRAKKDKMDHLLGLRPSARAQPTAAPCAEESFTQEASRGVGRRASLQWWHDE